jgi:2-polyprenyl-3-methyl-5-hydroxy-6-metoxy-1,4-benzoquinol methylase
MNDKSKKTVLTDVEFWEKGWGDIEFPIHLDPEKRVERVFMRLFDKYLVNDVDDSKKECIEIGCNPGKFLIYCNQNLGYEINGIDYDEKGVAITERNIKDSGLDGRIMKKDFFGFEVDEKYDLVLSLGFIEHFQGEKLQDAIELHIRMLKPGGKLFLSVPNFRYINYLFAYLFRKKILEVHNLEIMQKSFFEDIADQNDLNIEYLGYFGGLHPGGIKIGNKNLLSKIITDLFIHNFEKLTFLDSIDSKYFSHHIGAVYKKP